jgi:hypothetical protein
MDGFGHFHELVFAQLAVVVFVEGREKLSWVWWLVASTTFGAARICLAASTGLAASATRAPFSHLFARLGPLFVVEFAVFVRVKFFEHPLAPLCATIVASLAVLLWRLGEGRQGQRGGRKQCETRDEISHFCSFRSSWNR